MFDRKGRWWQAGVVAMETGVGGRGIRAGVRGGGRVGGSVARGVGAILERVLGQLVQVILARDEDVHAGPLGAQWWWD